MDQDSASFWWQMFDSGGLTKKVFALCYARYDVVDRLGTEAGALSLGGIDSRLPATPMVYTVPPSSSRRGFYDVTIRNIYLRAGGGGTSATSTDPNLSVTRLDVPSSAYGNVIVDSGTTDTYFSRSLATKFGELYQSGLLFKHLAPSLSRLVLQTMVGRFQNDANVTNLVVDAQGVVVGVRLLVFGAEHFVSARRGVVLAAGGSGHGFKLAPSVGEGMCQLVLGEPVTAFDADFFSPARFAGGATEWGGRFGL